MEVRFGSAPQGGEQKAPSMPSQLPQALGSRLRRCRHVRCLPGDCDAGTSSSEQGSEVGSHACPPLPAPLPGSVTCDGLSASANLSVLVYKAGGGSAGSAGAWEGLTVIHGGGC